MREFLSNPWTIGIGGTFIASLAAGLLLYYWPRVLSRLTTRRKPSLAPNPKQIMDQLDAVPPLQRDQVAANYKGIPVKWNVNLYSTSTTHSGQTVVFVRYKNRRVPVISFAIDLETYPQLKVLLPKHPIVVEGEIGSIDPGLSIELINAAVHI